MTNVPETDPYAPPPRYKMRSGAIMRFIVLAALLGAAAWGYVAFTSQPQQASLTSPPQQEQLADSNYQVSPASEASPPATPATQSQ